MHSLKKKGLAKLQEQCLFCVCVREGWVASLEIFIGAG